MKKTVKPNYQFQAKALNVELLMSNCFDIAELPETDGLLGLKAAMEIIQTEENPTKAFERYMSAINDLTEYELSQIKIVPCGMPISGYCDELVRLLIHSGAKIK